MSSDEAPTPPSPSSSSPASPAPPAGAALLWRDLRLGAAFLTRLPVHLSEEESARPLAEAVWTFPVIGAGVGLISGAALWLGLWLGLDPLAAALFGITAAVLLTGGLHEDGLADVADGFGAGADKTAKLRIMRDSRIGAYGVLALFLGLGLRVTIVAGMIGPGTALLALVSAGIASRTVLPVMMHLMTPARRNGLGHGAGRPHRTDVTIACLIGGGAVLGCLGLIAGLIAFIATAIAYIIVSELARRQIGGFTGDVLGALQQGAEVLVLAAVASATL